MTSLNMLEKKIGYQFKNQELLKQALTHRSVRKDNNERLEFLGDSVLSFIMTEELYRRYPDLREGELSRLRSILVNGEMLAELARAMGIGEHIELGQGELRSGGNERTSILADVFESILGAMYLDTGIEKSRLVVLNWFSKKFDNLSELRPVKDPKSMLQEWLQARKLPLPHYEAVASGKAHEQIFHVTCTVKGLPHKTMAESSNRRKAEQLAAEYYLELINE